MPRYIPLSTLPSQLLPHVRSLTSIPLTNPLRQLPSPSEHLLALARSGAAVVPPNVRVQEFIDGRGRWEGVSQVERLGGKKSVTWGVDKIGRKHGGLKSALREK